MAKLFVTLAILCVFGAVLVKSFDKNAAGAIFMTKVGECKTDTGAKDADVEEMLGKKPASTKEGKCLRACIMKKYDVMDANGKFVKAVAMSYAEQITEADADKMKIANEICDACSAIAVSDDHCKAAAQYLKCFKEQSTSRSVDQYLQF